MHGKIPMAVVDPDTAVVKQFSKEVVELATAVVKQLQADVRYKSTLPNNDTLTRVCEYVQTLPVEGCQRLLGITADDQGKAKVKGSGIEQLADTIGRSFASYNKSGNYTDEEHRKALYNFRVLQQSKFNDDVVSLGPQIVDGLNQEKAK